MIKEQDWIIFYVIVIKIFDHFPDQTNTYTMLIKVPKNVGLSVDGKKKKINKDQVMPCTIISICTEHNIHIHRKKKKTSRGIYII